MTYKGLADLKGRTIATSYEGLLGKFLKSNGIKASIVTMEGAVEIAPRTHLADVICDLVSTGNTLASNGLVREGNHSGLPGRDHGEHQHDEGFAQAFGATS